MHHSYASMLQTDMPVQIIDGKMGEALFVRSVRDHVIINE
jgi:hypothetical protein